MYQRILLTGCVLAAVWMTAGCGGAEYREVSGDRQKDFAAELVNKALYSEAVDEYRSYLAHTPLDDNKKANVNYIIADIYLENIKDYQKALTYYIKIKNLYPESGLISQVNKRIVECLERLGRSLDAAQELSEASTLEKKTGTASGKVIATVGSRQITDKDLQNAIEALPADVKKDITTREKRLAFLQNYVARDLIFEAAKRKGFAEDPEIIRQLFDIKKEILIQKFIAGEMDEKVRVDSAAVRLYYQAHRERYTDGEGDKNRPLSIKEAWYRVQNDLLRERQQETYVKLMQRMLTAEDVAIYDDLVQ